MRNGIAFLILMIHLIVELVKNDLENHFMCGADILIGQLGPFSFLWGVILPIILTNQEIVKYNFKYQHVIRSSSWKSILISQIKKLTWVSALISMTYILFVVLYCKWNGVVLCNWDSCNSLFYIYTQKQLEISGIFVYVYAFLCVFLRCVLINHILLMFLWVCEHKTVGVLVILCLIFAEAILGVKLICRLFSFDYHIWSENGERLRMVVQSAVYVVITIIMYRYLLLRKEKVLCE